jgi:hypothetical protein
MHKPSVGGQKIVFFLHGADKAVKAGGAENQTVTHKKSLRGYVFYHSNTKWKKTKARRGNFSEKGGNTQKSYRGASVAFLQNKVRKRKR